MTTQQSIIKFIRDANIVPSSSVNYGITDGLQPPYIGVDRFEYTTDYDTCAKVKGPYTRDSVFAVICLHKSADEVQELAEQVLSIFTVGAPITPFVKACFLRQYRMGQGILGDRPLYQWAVEITFNLIEALVPTSSSSSS